MLQRHRFDVHEYHRMIESGILMEGARIELIDGEIVGRPLDRGVPSAG